MIALDLPTLTLEILAGGAKTTTDPHWTTTYRNISKDAIETFSNQRGKTNGTTAQTAVPSPKAGDKHVVSSITIHNADSVNTTVTVRINDGTTTFTVFKVTLATLENAIFEEHNGWKVI
jgi:hypothetical protein